MTASGRPSGRKANALRTASFEVGYARHAEGSCLIRLGNTHVLCTASVETRLPPWRRESGLGWITAEYGMLPRSTHTRTDREAVRGKQVGRTQEIQRLIGRALRAVADFKAMGEMQVRVDCDVLQADGGTRTAAITGGYVALHAAFDKMVMRGVIRQIPLTGAVAAVSCGIYNGTPVLDLDYDEDRCAEADANFVLTGTGGIVEVQASAEAGPFDQASFDTLILLARRGCAELVDRQYNALGSGAGA